ncbi:hypothetical protein M595_5284 [Lyngbya aestuarii BL J]|uniref:Uncharacterized protein n=1 Tax=Lyngbya aestuarii BL J TaxID=1348334 RepID=U7QAB6_9CYAN|nr:hypothetical protein M595_5284 [Lyngbya aestuarii BL J]
MASTRTRQGTNSMRPKAVSCDHAQVQSAFLTPTGLNQKRGSD